MTDIERLAAIEDIKQLQARRVRALDTRDWKLYATCHAPDMEHELGGATVSGIDKVIEKVAKGIEGAVTIHHVHSPEIEILSPTSARGIWVLQDRLIWPNKWVHGFGHYFDTYEKRSGGWVFTSRRITRLRVESGKISNT